MSSITGTLTLIDALDKLGERILELPKQPDTVVSRFGRGANPAFGRTERHAIPRKHPKLDTWTIPVKLLRRVWQAYQAGELPKPITDRIASLTDAQRLAIRNAIRDAVDLPDDWKPASGIG